MMTCEERTIYRGGGPVYIGVVVTLDPTNPDNDGLLLDEQPIVIGFDQVTWFEATWIGVPGTTRAARILLAEDDFPTDTVSVFYRITADPEAPVEYAGSITFL